MGNLREVVAAIDGAATPFLRLDLDYDQVKHTSLNVVYHVHRVPGTHMRKPLLAWTMSTSAAALGLCAHLAAVKVSTADVLEPQVCSPFPPQFPSLSYQRPRQPHDAT